MQRTGYSITSSALLKKPRYVEAECLGSLEVDEELEFGR